MIVCLRLLAGFTSLRLKRWRSQRVSIGPVGHFESSSMWFPQYVSKPVSTAMGMEQLPMAIRIATTAAAFLESPGCSADG